METNAAWALEGMAQSAPAIHDYAAYARWAFIAAMCAQFVWLGAAKGRIWLAGLAGSVGVYALAALMGWLASSSFAMSAAMWMWDRRAATWPDAWWSWAACFLAYDYCAYWIHRLKHSSALFWAYHEPHHSFGGLDMSVNLRSTNLQVLFGWLAPAIPLAWAGFHPFAVASCMFASASFQIISHAYGWLGPTWLDLVLATPASHAVHHAKNLKCLDKNCGEVFMFWDRIHGTYARPSEIGDALEFGDLMGPVGNNPLAISFRAFLALWRKARAQKGMSSKLRCVFGAPGWSREEGDRWTVAGMRRASADGESTLRSQAMNESCVGEARPGSGDLA